MTASPRSLLERQWHSMLESQIRTCGIQNEALLQAMHSLPRHNFVPDALRPLAYADTHLRLPPMAQTTTAAPLSAAQRYVLSPSALAQMIALLDPQPFEKGLDMLCNCGYSTAILSLLCDGTIGVEIDPSLAAFASQQLDLAQVQTAAVVALPIANFWRGYAKSAPYDFIFINASLPELAGEELDMLCKQLCAGGRLVCGQLRNGHHRLVCYQRESNRKQVRLRVLRIGAHDVALPPLPAPLLEPIIQKQGFAKRYGFA